MSPRRLALLAALLPFAGSAVRAEAPASTPAIDRVLVLDPVTRGGRSAVFTDPVEARRVRGDAEPPREGETVALPDGATVAWRSLAPGPDGAFPEDPAFQGGYAHATVSSAAEGVWLLEGGGWARVFVEGEPRMGDPYGSIPARVPVRLRAGENRLLFRCGRGAFRARFVAPPAPVFLAAEDATTPDAIRGEGGTLLLGILVVNATTATVEGARVVASAPGAPPRTTSVPALPPLGRHKAAIAVEVPAEPEGDRIDVTLALEGRPGAVTVPLAVRAPGERHRRTFLSALDRSVQYYAVTPARPGPGDSGPPALVLTLHGASVEATGQAAAYEPKSWAHVVAPTNRRPFGFDWEDWGRRDAREVLALAAARYGTDPRRTYLTGHSMGGHGTWILGAQSPGTFAAIAPSAGWRDFWAYGGAPDLPAEDPVLAVLSRAANVHRLALWEPNLAEPGIYVLHGDADDNVPVSEARAMRERLGRFHPDFAYHERPGAGHWWGNECVDWPPLFDFLRRRLLPEARPRVAFTTLSTDVLSQVGWLRIEAQARPLLPSRVEGTLSADGRRVEVSTENVAVLALEVPDTPRAEAPGRVVLLDGREVPGAAGRYERGADGTWRAAPGTAAPGRVGTFKEAFGGGLVLVYGTRGTPEENAWSLAKARYDAEQLAYRGNGAPRVVADVDPALDAGDAGRGAIVYGHREMNAAWDRLAPGCPVDVARGSLRVGERRLEGPDRAVLFAWRGAGGGAIAVVAGTGMPGLRATDVLPYFVSGIAHPDWCVLAADLAARGGPAFLGAGFLAPDGSLGDDLAWRE